MKQWVVAGTTTGNLEGDSFDHLEFEEAPVPKCGENEVLVKLHAASLNYRDLVIPKVRNQNIMVEGGAYHKLLVFDLV